VNGTMCFTLAVAGLIPNAFLEVTERTNTGQ